MDYNSIISEVELYKTKIQVIRTDDRWEFFYRGQSEDWPIKTSLHRAIENGMIDKNQQSIIEWDRDLTAFENIAYMQHYNYPTRLLDYSMDVDVALFFACCDKSKWNKDGTLYVVPNTRKREIKYIDVMLMTEINSLYEKIKLTAFADMILQKYPEFLNGIFFYNMLGYPPNTYSDASQQRIGKEELSLRVLSWIDYGFMVKPSEEEYNGLRKKNPRLYYQKGAFFMVGNQIEPSDIRACSRDIGRAYILPKLADVPDTIFSPEKVKKIIIQKNEKKNILQKLEEKGINKFTLRLGNEDK